METISATLIRQQLTEVIRNLSPSDPSIAITKHGKVVALLTLPEIVSEASEAPAPDSAIPEPAEPSQDESEPAMEVSSEDGAEGQQWETSMEEEFEAHISNMSAHAF